MNPAYLSRRVVHKGQIQKGFIKLLGGWFLGGQAGSQSFCDLPWSSFQACDPGVGTDLPGENCALKKLQGHQEMETVPVTNEGKTISASLKCFSFGIMVFQKTSLVLRMLF